MSKVKCNPVGCQGKFFGTFRILKIGEESNLMAKKIVLLFHQKNNFKR
jgi:hypothetical protein